MFARGRSLKKVEIGEDLMLLFRYFDRTAIIHLPERVDRMTALRKELVGAGFDLSSPKLAVPNPPRPSDANGFVSKGVYGNFLSHLQILKSSYTDGLENVLVLEDDAIFSRTFISKQNEISMSLASNPWDIVFFGHSVGSGLPKSASHLVTFSGKFQWSHCYGVNRRIMPRIIQYFEETLQREAGHPNGGKMYIDAAHNEFRRLNPDVICLLGAPCLSVQRGSPSSLGEKANWYDTRNFLKRPLSWIRSARDQFWRMGFITIGPPEVQKQWTRIDSAHPWP